MSAPPLLDLIDRLTHTTAEALDAALGLRADELRLLDQKRADLVFEVQLEVQNGPDLTDDERTQLKARLEDLRALERRLGHIAGVVTHALRPLDGPPKPALYAPNGNLRG